jgi:predicted transposase/invertase (TIGR01784 family)
MINDTEDSHEKEQSTSLVPLISDYGFKISFATDSIFSRKALQVLINSDVPIERLEMSRNELEGISFDARSGFYDVVCKDEHLRIFIVEMQVDNYTSFIERLLFYCFHMYCSLVTKGKMGFKNLPPIYCVCIIEGSITEFEGFYNIVNLKNEKGMIFSDNIEFHLVELGKFPILQHEFHKVKTDMEKLAYTLKYAHKINPKKEEEKPNFWKEDWLDEVLAKVDTTRMTAEEKVLFDMSLVKEVAYQDKLKQVAENASNERAKKTVILSFQKGLDLPLIASVSDLSLDEVTSIIEAYKKGL